MRIRVAVLFGFVLSIALVLCTAAPALAIGSDPLECVDVVNEEECSADDLGGGEGGAGGGGSTIKPCWSCAKKYRLGCLP